MVILTFLNQLLIQKVLSEQKYDAVVINLAGRQRMLSQKIVKEVYQVVNGEFELQLLKNEVNRWALIHIGLQKGNEALGLPELKSKPIRELFDQLSPFQNAVSLSILSSETVDELKGALPELLKNETLFLFGMDEIVFAFEAESQTKIRNLILLEIILAFFSLLVLFIEFMFIFKPLLEEIEEENIKLGKTISELSASKGALFKSTQRFDLSIEAINAGIWDWYIPDDTEWWSDKFLQLLGYKKDEIKATYHTFLYELVHPDDREKVEQAVKAHLENKEEYRLEIRMKTKDGEYRWFESVGQANWDYQGNPIRMVGSIIDINDMKQFQKQVIADQVELRNKTSILEKTLAQISEIQQVAHIGIWHVDLETMTALWSEEVYRIHEVPIGTEIKVEDGIKFYREDYRPLIQKAIDKAIEENKPWNLDCVLLTARGREIWVRAIGYPVFKEDKLVSLRGLFMNIDEQKRAQIEIEKKTKESEELSTKLSLAVNVGRIGIWVWDIETNGLEWDDQMLEIYGITRQKFTDGYDSYSESVLPEDLPRIEKELQYSLKSKERFDTNFRIRKPDGSIRYIVAKADLVLNEEGNPIGMIGINYDTTNLEEAKRVIEIKELQLRRFVEQAPVAVAMLDKEMNYLSVSNQWYKEYAISTVNIIGLCHYDVFPEIRRMPEWLAIHEEVLSGKGKVNTKDKFLREDGSIQYLSWKLIPWYNELGEVGGMIMYSSDITNEIKYQETLENLNEVLEHQVKMRTKELEIVNKELESFSYSISHDLRAPLRSINGFADILEEDYGEKLDDEGKRLLEVIRSSGVKMGQLIDDILAFSRLGRKELKKGRVDMAEVVEEVIREVSSQYSTLSIEFKVAELPGVKGDLALLKQVMVNLLSNAIKYSSLQKIVTIEVGSLKKDDFIVFSLKDNGAGFDMRYHDKMFGVFQRLHGSNEFEGTGVGLAIVKRIITKHGGEI